MFERKYEMTSETMKKGNVTVHRIRYLRDIPKYGVAEGDLGGFIQTELNLKHSGDAVILGDAVVMDDAHVKNSAIVKDEAVVSMRATIVGSAVISVEAQVMGDAVVGGNAMVSDYAIVKDNAHVTETAKVLGYVTLSDSSRVSGQSALGGHVKVSGQAQVSHNCEPKGKYEKYHVFGDVQITGNASVESGAIIQNIKRYKNETEESDANAPLVIKGTSCIKGNAFIDGGGIIADSFIFEDVSISGFSTVKKSSILKGSANIKDSFITDSTLQDNAVVLSSTITGCRVTEDAQVRASILQRTMLNNRASIRHSEVYGGHFLDEVSVDNSKLKGIFEISGHAELVTVKMEDAQNVLITGSAVVRNTDFYQNSSVVIDENALLDGQQSVFEGNIAFKGSNITITGHAEVRNPDVVECLEFTGSLISIRDYACIDGCFNIGDEVYMSDFSLLQGDGFTKKEVSNLTLSCENVFV
ncbi:hypothetical protein [Rossellomorea marisflavi]|uniref:hypothetical protein n=1 Tax=Rossellomorea marisflavi TaxID=189381 RepID=UPI003FA134CF